MIDLAAKVASVPGAEPYEIDTGSGIKATVSNDFWPNCALCCKYKLVIFEFVLEREKEQIVCILLKVS